MTKKDFIKWIKDYFVDITFSEKDINRVDYALGELIKANTKTVEVTKLVKIPKEKIVYRTKPVYIEKPIYVNNPVPEKELVYRVVTQEELPKAVKIKKKPTLDDIAKIIIKKHRVSLEQIKTNEDSEHYKDGKKRMRKYIDARRDFVHTALETYPFTLTEIAKFLGCHHSTVIHLKKCVVTNYYSSVSPADEVRRKYL